MKIGTAAAAGFVAVAIAVHDVTRSLHVVDPFKLKCKLVPLDVDQGLGDR